jgi:hypothetical protein
LPNSETQSWLSRNQGWADFPLKSDMFMKTRREFLRDCSLIAGTVTVVPAVALAQKSDSMLHPGGTPGLEEFRRFLNTRFTVQTGGGQAILTLVQAVKSPSVTVSPEMAGNENFTLLFHGARHSRLSQNTYAFEHSGLGRFSIFIAPVGLPAETHHCYEAVFSRPASATELAWQISRAPKRVVKC